MTICPADKVKSLVHWWPLDQDTLYTSSAFQVGPPERLVPDIMGRRYAWRGVDTSYASKPGLRYVYLPPQDPGKPMASRLSIPNGDQALQMLRTAFTLEWTMEFPAQADQYIFFQPTSSAGSTELVCVLGQQNQVICDINGGKLGWSLDPAKAFGSAHHWALTYDRAAQKIALFLDGVALPAGPRTVVADWNEKTVTTSDLAFMGSDKTVHDLRLWNRALSAAEIANEFAKGPCSVAAPLQFNAAGKPDWPGTGSSPLPTTLFPLYDIEAGFSGFAQPPPAQGPRGPGFNFNSTSSTNMPSVDITTTRAFRVEHVSSYHDANDQGIHPNLTIVGELSLPGETGLLAAGYRELYRGSAPATGSLVASPVATPITMLPGTYKFRWRPENGPNAGSTQVSFPWVYMVGTRL